VRVGALTPARVGAARCALAGVASTPGMTRCWPVLSCTLPLGSLFSFTSVATLTPYRFASEVSVSPGFTS